MTARKDHGPLCSLGRLAPLQRQRCRRLVLCVRRLQRRGGLQRRCGRDLVGHDRRRAKGELLPGLELGHSLALRAQGHYFYP